MANLATMIMEGATYSQNGSSIDTSKYDFSKEATMESDFANSAVVALYSDIMEAEKAYMAADVISAAQGLQAKSVNESFEMKPIIEGMIKDFFSKIVEGLKKFWAKIVEWFKKVFEWFRMMFSNAKEFAKRYGKELRNKKYGGFKWEGFEWTLKAGDDDAKKWAEAFSSNCDNLGGKLVDVTKWTPAPLSGKDDEYDDEDQPKARPTASTQSTSIKKDSSQDTIKNNIILAAGAGKWEEGKSVSDFIDDIIKRITEGAASDQSEMRSNLEEKYRSGSSEKTTITDFDCGQFKNPGNVIDFLEKGEKQISEFEKARKNIEKPINTLIKTIDKIKTTTNDEKSYPNLTSNISFASSLCTSLLNCVKTCYDVQIAAYKAALSELLGVMKRFYSFKSATESMDMYDVESLGVLESVSILEGKDDSDDDKSSKDDSDDSDKDSKRDDDSKEDEEEASESVKHILEMAHSFSF